MGRGVGEDEEGEEEEGREGREDHDGVVRGEGSRRGRGGTEAKVSVPAPFRHFSPPSAQSSTHSSSPTDRQDFLGLVSRHVTRQSLKHSLITCM